MAESKPKRLLRSDDRIVGGVLGGIGEYLGVDPTAVRVVYVIIAFLSGIIPMVAAYAVLLFVIPKRQ